MKRHLIALSYLAAGALVFSSCKKETDHNVPAFHIAESEKLVIPSAVSLPANLPNGNARVVTYYAEGVQKYKAQIKAGSSPVTYEWVFVAPLADLFDNTNKKKGNHGAGPYWQLSVTDSVFAQHYATPKTAPSPDPGSIDWLLLIPRSDKPRTGVFADVSYIQRIATKGGKPPVVLPQSLTETADVKYTAIYRFSKIKP